MACANPLTNMTASTWAADWESGPGLICRHECKFPEDRAVRKSVLVVAQQIELRARIARVLHSAGYGAELAGNQKRALELAARKDVQAAIVVHSTDLAGLGQKLRRKIPTTIVVGHRTDEIVRPGNSLQGTDAFPEDALDEQKLLDRLSQLAASPGSKRDETVPAPVKIEDCKLDLAGHTFVDGSGREVRLNRARDRVAVSDGASETRLYQRHRWRSEGFHDEAKSWHGLARAVPARRREHAHSSLSDRRRHQFETAGSRSSCVSCALVGGTSRPTLGHCATDAELANA